MESAPQTSFPPSGTPAAFDSTSPATVNRNAERNWCMWCHLSALAGYVIPFGNVLGPLIVWQMKRNDFPAVDEHGKEALNFQLSVFIYLVGGGILTFVGAFFCIGLLLLPVLLVIPIVSLILTIVAGVKGNDGVLYRYPLTLRLVK